jgi:gamma-glutamyltranspeptidase
VRGENESGEYTIFGEQINFEMTPERGWPREVAESLQSEGFEVVPVEKHASFGRVHLVARSGDVWQGVADADWEGTAMSASCHAQ